MKTLLDVCEHYMKNKPKYIHIYGDVDDDDDDARNVKMTDLQNVLNAAKFSSVKRSFRGQGQELNFPSLRSRARWLLKRTHLKRMWSSSSGSTPQRHMSFVASVRQ